MSTFSSETTDTKDLGTDPLNKNTPQDQSTQLADQSPLGSDQLQDSNNEEVGEKVGAEEEEEEECGFCLFMKGGGCKDTFIAWEKCVEAERENGDISEKCFEVTSALRQCMEAHADYYEPIFRVEKAAEEEATKMLENEAAVEKEAVIESSPKSPSQDKQES